MTDSGHPDRAPAPFTRPPGLSWQPAQALGVMVVAQCCLDRLSTLGFWILDFGFWISDFGFWIWVRFEPVPPWSAGAICQPAVGGGGLRADAAALNNPAAGVKAAAGRAPGCGILSTGREPHAIPGVTLPLTVILTAHRLRSTRRPARQTASDFG